MLLRSRETPRAQDVEGALQVHLAFSLGVGKVVDSDDHIADVAAQCVGDRAQGGARHDLDLGKPRRNHETSLHGKTLTYLERATKGPHVHGGQRRRSDHDETADRRRAA